MLAGVLQGSLALEHGARPDRFGLPQPCGSPPFPAPTFRGRNQIELFRPVGLCFTLPMCYSAKVWQAYSEYIRTMGAPPDYAQIEELLTRRLTDKSIRIARGFERNFDSPKSPEERRIKDLIDQHRAVTITRLEQDLFAQKKRLADAQRKLNVKETKTALEDQRIASAKIKASLEKLTLLKGTQPHADDNRIFH